MAINESKSSLDGLLNFDSSTASEPVTEQSAQTRVRAQLEKRVHHRGRKRRQPKGRPINGVLILDKPQGLTSNAALQQVKKLLNASKAGHTGSLDPLATGVLPICFGEATKFSQYLLESDKAYLATAHLGQRSETGDADGEIIETKPVANFSKDDIERILEKFRGKIEQIPSMYSAIKHNGTPLYELARQGIEVERSARSVDILKLELKSIDLPYINIYVECTKGTYIRTLVEDIGADLGCGGHVCSLRRTKAGPFTVEEAVKMDHLQALFEAKAFNELNQLLLPMHTAVRDWPELKISENLAFYLQQGHPVQTSGAPVEGWVRLSRMNNDFIGVGEILSDGRVAPRRLLSQS